MSSIQTSEIVNVSWGQIIVVTSAGVQSFRDCKIWPGGATKWDWRITNTHHQPGIQPADIEAILEHGVEVMVLSRGMQLMLHICPETEQLLNSQAIKYYIEETKQAVDIFNNLIKQGKKVGGIFHSTC